LTWVLKLAWTQQKMLFWFPLQALERRLSTREALLVEQCLPFSQVSSHLAEVLKVVSGKIKKVKINSTNVFCMRFIPLLLFF
jgi:hypothetical protein